jgi:Pectate lyase superfamily protein
MAAEYPAAIPTIASNKQDGTDAGDATPGSTNVGDHSGHHNKLAEEVVAIAAELGVNPSSSYATVTARLNAIVSGSLWINVKDYGAVGDGGTDDRAAIQAALNAVPTSPNVGGVVYFPVGRYLIGSPGLSTTRKNIYLLGEVGGMTNIGGTPGAALIAFATNMTMLHIGVPSAEDYDGVRIENIGFYNPAANANVVGLRIQNRTSIRLSRCGFKDFTIGLDLVSEPTTDFAWNLFEDLHFYGNTVAAMKGYCLYGYVMIGGEVMVTDPASGDAYGIWLTGPSGGGSQVCKHYGVFFDRATTGGAGNAIAVYLERASNALFDGCKIESFEFGFDILGESPPDNSANRGNTIRSCSWSTGGTAVRISANPSDTLIENPAIDGTNSVGINDSGVRTRVVGGYNTAGTPFAGSATPEQISLALATVAPDYYNTQTRLGNGRTYDKLGFYGVTPVVRTTGYNAANMTSDRSFDANSYTMDELADVLGNLVMDLKAMGLIG